MLFLHNFYFTYTLQWVIFPGCKFSQISQMALQVRKIYGGLFLWFDYELQKNIIFSLINKQIISVTCYWSLQDPVHKLKTQDS